jgi:WD40 repeat protein/serine/threonine protein kinase
MNPQQIGVYEVRSEIGRGSLATVYLAYDPGAHRQVALKVIKSAYFQDTSLYARLKREIDLLVLLDHPAITPVYAVGETAGDFYIAMRYMPGGSLKDRLETGLLTLHEASRLIERLAPALDAAHAAGLLHLDLKPSNILFDENEQPFLTDFGVLKIARSIAPQLASRTIFGSPAYLSPEQAQGDVEVDGRSDIYALGCLLYEMLTGQLPFQSSTALGFAVQHWALPAPDARTHAPLLPAKVAQVISRAWSKERGERFTTAGELAEALHRSIQWRHAQTPGEVKKANKADQTVQPRRLAWRFVFGILLVLALVASYSLYRLIQSGYYPMAGQALPSASIIAQVPALPTPTPTITPGPLLTRAITPHPTEQPAAGFATLVLATAIASPTEPLVLVPTTPAPQTYVIQYNDTLFNIASQLDVDLAYLIGANGLQCDSRLYPGTLLLVPPPGIDQFPASFAPVSAGNLEHIAWLRTLDCVRDVRDVAFSPDGQILAVARDQFIYLWQVGVWKPLRRLKGHQSLVNAVKFSPDGQFIASGSTDATVRIWSVNDGTLLQTLKHGGEVTALVFSPDGALLASTATDQAARLWQMPAGSLLREYKGYAAYSVAFSPDGQVLAIGRSNAVDLYSLDGDTPIGRLDSNRAADNLIFSPDGLLLASSSDIWQPQDGKHVYQLERSVDRTAFTPDGRALIIGKQFWQVSSGKKIFSLTSPVEAAPRTAFSWDSIALGPNGLLAWGTPDGLFIFGVPADYASAGEAPASNDYIVQKDDNLYTIADQFDVSLSALLTENGMNCTSVYYTGQSLRIPLYPIEPFESNPQAISARNVAQLTSREKMDMTCSIALGDLALSPDGRYLVSGSALWDVQRRSILIQDYHRLEQEDLAPNAPLWSPRMVLSPDGQVLASRAGNVINLWAVQNGRLSNTLRGHTGEVSALAFSPDGAILASASGAGESVTRLWRVSDGALLKELTGFSAQRLFFTPTGDLLIMISGDTARLWKIKTAELWQTIQGIQGDLVPSPDGRLLAYIACAEQAGVDCTRQVVELYRLSDGKVGRTLQGETDLIRSLAFSSDGQILGIASGNAIVLWRIADGVILHKLRANQIGSETLEKMIFSGDDTLLLSVVDSRIVRLWEIASEKVANTITPGLIDSVIFPTNGARIAVLSGNDITLWGVAP